MQNQASILALFKDSDDETRCTPLLAGIPGIIRAVAGGNLAMTLENLKRTGIEPVLTILTARLYPESRPNLVTTVRGLFPATDFLLVSSTTDPFPPLQALAADRVRHMAINPAASPYGGEPESRARFITAVRKLVERSPWEIADYVKLGTSIHEFAISSSTEKAELIERVEAVIESDRPDMDLLRQKGALLADEMLENAMYGAPRGEDGSKLYQKGELRTIQPREGIAFRYGFDGETLAMEVVDGWGSLSPELIMEFLAKNQDGGEVHDEGGGRGLFIIWRFLDHFHVTICPGKKTVVGGHVRAASKLDPEAPRGFHISTHF